MMLCNMDVEQVIWANSCLPLVIYLWLHTDVNSYRIRSFVLAQECPRIDGVRRLMAYSILCLEKWRERCQKV